MVSTIAALVFLQGGLLAGSLPDFTGTASFNAADTLLVDVDFGVWEPGAFPVSDPSDGLEFVFIYQPNAAAGSLETLSVQLPDQSHAANADFVEGSGMAPSSWQIAMNTAVAMYSAGLADQSAILVLTSPNEPVFGAGTAAGGELTDQQPLPVPTERFLRPGDANVDGAVDASDLAVIRAGFGQSGGWTKGNFDDNRIVDAFDLQTVRGNFGKEEVVPTPEPASLVLLIGLTVCTRRRLA